MTSDLLRLDRVRSIPDNAITKTELGYEVKSQSDKHSEITYFVSYTQALGTTCTCKDFMFRNNEDNPGYTCKHIDKVFDMVLKNTEKGKKLKIKKVVKK